jgi:hypothetical protein
MTRLLFRAIDFGASLVFMPLCARAFCVHFYKDIKQQLNKVSALGGGSSRRSSLSRRLAYRPSSISVGSSVRISDIRLCRGKSCQKLSLRPRGRNVRAPHHQSKLALSLSAELVGDRVMNDNQTNNPKAPRCHSCARPMRLLRRTSRFGGLPDLYSFYCVTCDEWHVEEGNAPPNPRTCLAA